MSEQLPLMDEVVPEVPAAGVAASPPTRLSSRSSIKAALGEFESYMRSRGFTENTCQAFLSDVNILTQYVGSGTSLTDISTADLNRFVSWLQSGRGVPCNSKSLERRITTLKVFFGWLVEAAVLDRDPADPIVHRPVSTPLAEILSEEEIVQVLHTTQALRGGERPDARPHLLVTLLLETGVKKSECMHIALNHIDLLDAGHPAVWIRYSNSQRRHKERRLALPAAWPAVLLEYREQHKPKDVLFPCTARNLEYVLRDVAVRAGLRESISFEMLRWTCAVRDFRAGMSAEKLRQKMGLSKISWREVGAKVARLAGRSSDGS